MLICISPNGRLYFEFVGDKIDNSNMPDFNPHLSRIYKAFELSHPNGFLHLATVELDTALSGELDFFRRFGKLYMTKLCHLPLLGDVNEVVFELPAISPPSLMEFEFFLLNVPPVKGAEYLTSDILLDWWTSLDEFVRDQISHHIGGAVDWIRNQNPLWRTVGRVTFHLAENKQDESRPFAFMATYANNISAGAKPVQLPLSKALKEYVAAKDKNSLLRLLQPISAAAEKCDWIKSMLDDQTIYTPRAWTPSQAYRMLQDVPLLEESGLIVRVPNWWQSRKTSRPQVRINIDAKTNNKSFGMDSLLKFDIQTVLDGEALTEADLAELMNAEEGSLVRLRGQWVEVDNGKLQEALEHWKKIDSLVNENGMSFYEGMRLISGLPVDGKWNDTDKETIFREWSEVMPTGNFANILAAIRNPDKSHIYEIPFDKTGLNATLRPYQETGVRWLQLMSQLGLGACLADDMGLGKTIQVIALLAFFHTKSSAEIGNVADNVSGKVADNVSDNVSGKVADNVSDKVSDKVSGKVADNVSDNVSDKVSSKGADNVSDNVFGVGVVSSLLVVPASLIGNWESEIRKFAPQLSFYVAHSSGGSVNGSSGGVGEPDDLDKIDLVITTYGMVERIGWIKSHRWRTVILDEAQAIRNAETKQSRAVKALRTAGRIVLTGTPIENRLSDLWSLFDFLNPGLLGTASSFKKFIKSTSGDNSQANFAPLRKLTQPYILRRLKTDKRIISDLPDKTEVTAWCNLSKKQAILYSQSVKMLADELRQNSEGIKRRGLILSYLMRFKQICNHPAQWLGDGDYEASLSGKFIRLGEICEEIAERQEKTLVFTQFREITEQLAMFLQTIFLREGFILDGKTPIKKRREMVEAFQMETGAPFFILSLKAGGTGLNLTAAQHVIHFDRWWNPAVENQATDRAFRIGQKKNVLVHKFVCRGTIEERIDAMIESKKTLANEIIEPNGDAALVTEMTDEQLLQMVTLDINKAQEV